MVSLDYRFNSNVMVYARVARGFKSGGFNGRANSVAERTQYEPETVTSYEIGLRSTIANQLRLNVTAFYNDYRNFQARVSGTGLDPVTGLPSPNLSVINAGRLNIQGVEVEAAWTPVPGLLIDAQVATSTRNMRSSATSASPRRQPRLPGTGFRAALDAPSRRAI